MLSARASQPALSLRLGLSTPLPRPREATRALDHPRFRAQRRPYAAPPRLPANAAPYRRWRGFDPSPKLLLGALIAPSVGLFAYSAYAGDRAQRGDFQPSQFLRKHFVLSLKNVREGRWYTIVSAGFMHFGLGHIAFNSIALYTFGQGLLTYLAPSTFLAVYFSSMIAGSCASLANRAFFRKRDYDSVGASAGVVGTVMVTALLQPWSTIILLVVPLPAILVVAGSVGLDLYNVANPGTLRMVDSSGHLGGYAMGALWFLLRLRRGRGFRGSLR